MIRNILFRLTKAKALGVVCLAAITLLLPLQAQGRSPKVQQFEGKLTFNHDLPVDMVAGTAEHPKLVEVKSIRFDTAYGNAWGVTARVGWLPVKDTAWQLKVELLDDKGQALRHSRDDATVFTCKAGATGRKEMLYIDLDLGAMHDQGRRHATQFRIYLEPLQVQVGDTDSANIKIHTLEIVVVDQENKKPIADAAVVVRNSYIKQTYKRYSTLYATDSQGHCRIKIAKDGLSMIWINAQKPGFATISKIWSNYGSSAFGRVPLVNLPQRRVLEMVPTGSVGGIVQDTEGNPIEAVEVCCEVHQEEPSGMIYINRCVQTDAKGNWRVDWVPPEMDRVSLRLRHPEYGGDSRSSRRITGRALLNAKALKHVEVLKKGPTIKGKILDDQEEPVIGATVLMVKQSIYTLTDASGAFSFVCTADESAYFEAPTIIVEAPGYVPAQQKIYIKPKLEPLEFRLKRGRSITCRVVDKEGRPVVGAWTVVEPLPDNSRYSVWLKETDEQGEFKVPNVPENDINLTVGKQGYIAVRDYALSASEDEVVVTMKRAFRVHGTVTDAQSSKPIPNFEIADVYKLGGRTRTSNPVTFTEGKYELSFDEARPETRQLKVSAVGYEEAVSEEIDIDEGRRTIDFKLVRSRSFDKATAGRPRQEVKPTGPRRITGIVRDDKGKPLSDAAVSTQPRVVDDTITNAEGVFTLKLWRQSASRMRSTSSRNETTYLFVRHKERNLAAAIELDDKAETLDVKLSPGVILSGKVIDVEGKGIPDAELFLTCLISGSRYSSREAANIDAQGNYEIKAVPSGHRYSVNASAEGFGQQRAQTAEAADDRMELEPMVLAVADLSVSGVVVDIEDKPVVGAGIYAYGRGQPQRNTITNEMGRFLIENMCAGRIQIQASTNDKTRLRGHIDTEGGATDIKIVIAQRDARDRPVPKKSPSLVGKPLPDLSSMKIDSTPTQAKRMVLVCFFDMNQRPSRNCIMRFAKQAEQLKQKGIAVIAVQASKADENRLREWIKANNIPFPVGMIQGDEEKTRFSWGARSLPWLILTDKQNIVQAEGFSINELDERISARREK